MDTHSIMEILNNHPLPQFIQHSLKVISQKQETNTIEEILLLPFSELKSLTGLPPHDVSKLFSYLSSLIITNNNSSPFSPPTVYELLNSYSWRLSWGDNILNNTLGGVCPKGITEIVGESSSGKTQLCFQLMVQSQQPLEVGGIDGSVLYISTEGTPFSKCIQTHIH